MMPIGPLMIEHRLIERMVGLLGREADRIAEDERVDAVFIDQAVDFIRTYADRTHHGKEEDILFRDLDDEDLSSKDRDRMEELVREHVLARKTVGELVEAKESYLEGETEALDTLLQKLDVLVEMYPEHIRKEDKVFFPASMEYLDQAEQDAMLEEMWEFDRQMIHEKYESVVEELESETEQ
jgi:hemerythrin-like domain-containing protein